MHSNAILNNEQLTYRLKAVRESAIDRANVLKNESFKNTWDLSSLPSSRALEKHPHSITYSLHSDNSKIAPVWTKLSHTAFDGRSKLLGGGYGRRMKNTSISNDCPEFFPNPERHPTVVAMNRQRAEEALSSANNILTLTKTTGSIPHAGQNSQTPKTYQRGSKYRTFAYTDRNNKKQTVLDPLITERIPEPIEWRKVSPPDVDFMSTLNARKNTG